MAELNEHIPIHYSYRMSTLQSCSGVNGKALWLSAVDKNQ